jgi:hypothetical protein
MTTISEAEMSGSGSTAGFNVVVSEIGQGSADDLELSEHSDVLGERHKSDDTNPGVLKPKDAHSRAPS